MKKIIIFLMISTLIYSNSFEDYKKIQGKNYNSYKTNQEKEFQDYKRKIAEKWQDIEIFTPKSWVEYSDNFNEKRIIDYENQYIKSEIIVDKNASKEEIDKKLEKNIEDILSQTTGKAIKTIPNMENSQGKSSETLVGDIYQVDEKNDGIKKASKKLIKKGKREIKKALEEGKSVVEIKIPFPKGGLSKKSLRYQAAIKESSNEKRIPEKLIYSIIECESSFNPMAISSVPAYGLMQIVPRSAGKDISKKIEGTSRLYTPEELYVGKDNIYYGVTYLNILYYSYLKKIEDPTSRIYCTIAAYNTGAGNVAKAFTGNTDINRASKIINNMNNEDVYEKLIEDLPYSETKFYLKKLRKTMKKY